MTQCGIEVAQEDSVRIVLEHTRGTWSGMRQILGTVDQVKASLQVDELPSYIANLNFGDRVNGASLVAVKRSYILYRELIAPTNMAFNPLQQ